MAVKFFGQFLVEKGIVSREALLKAIELQETVNLKFGETALEMGLISVAEVERVHKAQWSADLQFGDMAVQLGIITETQMQQVLTRQKNSHLYLGEALIQVGALEREGLDRYLQEFKADQAPYVTDKTDLPPGVPHQEMWGMLADLTSKMLARIANLTVRPGQCQLADHLAPNCLIAAIEITGQLKARYLLSVSAGPREAIARAMLGQESIDGESQELLDDTIAEFINVVCGNFAAKAAQLGKTVEIEPPQLLQPGTGGADATPGQKGLLFPFHLADGELIEAAIFVDA
jgi:CheY-specific phosphatase CheX